MSVLGPPIAAEFQRILNAENLTVSAAARTLQISRQAFHNYLNGKSIPRSPVLARAAQLWGFQVAVGQVLFDRSSFPTPPTPESEHQQMELELWKKLDAISEQDLHIELTREGKALHVAVKIDIPA